MRLPSARRGHAADTCAAACDAHQPYGTDADAEIYQYLGTGVPVQVPLYLYWGANLQVPVNLVGTGTLINKFTGMHMHTSPKQIYGYRYQTNLLVPVPVNLYQTNLRVQVPIPNKFMRTGTRVPVSWPTLQIVIYPIFVPVGTIGISIIWYNVTPIS